MCFSRRGTRLMAAFALLFSAAVAFGRDDGFLVGEFEVERVVDGDTIAVGGLDSTIRFLCIDTEECEKGPGAEERTEKIAGRFVAYARERVREDPLGQFTTPMGLEAKKFAKSWFPLGSRVRVEYDSLSRKTGYFSRVLGYVFVNRDGRWVNYNIECVRAGMSPYFDKYGKSGRFEAEFIAAEREARIHGRGIWSGHAMSYPNYDERMAAWWRRAETMARFEEKYGTQENAIMVIDEHDWQRLPGLLGQEVLLLGNLKRSGATLQTTLLELHHKEFERVALQFPDADLFYSVEEFTRAFDEDFIFFRGIISSGAERNGRTYRYSLSVLERGHVFAEIPGADSERMLPSKGLDLSGDRIHWKDAKKHVDLDVAVAGKVVRTANIGSIIFLNFDQDFRNTLSIVIKEESFDSFPEAPDTTYANRTILVRGKITEHKGSPQIVVSGPGQIEILE